jgi:23S rRNA maturation mini-RNase III
MKMALTMFMLGGCSVAGYMYLQKHPEKLNALKKNTILDKSTN